MISYNRIKELLDTIDLHKLEPNVLELVSCLVSYHVQLDKTINAQDEEIEELKQHIRKNIRDNIEFIHRAL